MMDSIDYRLIEVVQNGLPISVRPYQEIGRQLNLSEQAVIDRLTRLRKLGLVRRLGVIVNHRRLGYCSNAMVVLDVPDHLIDQIGGHISQFGFISLCYRRPRQGSVWPYNLYFMIHGKSRQRVLEQVDLLSESCRLNHFSREILFSQFCFKQRGALYKPTASLAEDIING